MWVCRLPVHIGPLGSCEFADSLLPFAAACCDLSGASRQLPLQGEPFLGCSRASAAYKLLCRSAASPSPEARVYRPLRYAHVVWSISPVGGSAASFCSHLTAATDGAS